MDFITSNYILIYTIHFFTFMYNNIVPAKKYIKEGVYPMSKKSKQILLILLSFLLFSMPLFNVSNAIAAGKNYSCEQGKCLEVPKSNVNDKKFDEILTLVKQTEKYKDLSSKTVINDLTKKDIVINTINSNGKKIATISFIIGKKIQTDNLAYVELVYDIEKNVVNTSKLLYGYLKENNLINISMTVNDEKAFSMDINEKGEIIQNDTVISQDDFYNQAVEEMQKDSISTSGWCEWTMAALCGAGGAAACYALAIGLGLTTGIGGLGLATVCGLIASLGCTAATKKVCG